MIIGLTGFAESGKSTVAEYLERQGFERVSFAGPLKKMLRTLNPVLAFEDSGDGPGIRDEVRAGDIFELPGWTEKMVKAEFPEYRRLLQALGTDCIREIDPDFWINAAKAMLETGKDYVFDDVRFPNEAEVIKELNPDCLWNIIRPGTEPSNGHASEQWAGKLGERHHIINDFTLKDLYAQTGAILTFVQQKAGVAA